MLKFSVITNFYYKPLVMTDELMSIDNRILKKLEGRKKPLTIGIVAGEASGDALGSDFMQKLNAIHSDINWVGVGGSNMQKQGLKSLFPLSRLAVMGLVEVIKHLPDLFKARDEILHAFDKANIDIFIGIDAPDFNLRVAKKLKPNGVYCVQYVSPSVWAWRESRIHGIKKATDLVLCLFPFELPVYQKHNHPAKCVGHSLLHSIDDYLLNTPKLDLRTQLVWDNQGLQQFFVNRYDEVSQLVCMMPGSRRSEINAMLPLFLDSVHRLLLIDKNLCFIIPTIDENHQYIVKELLEQRPKHVQEAVTVVFDASQPNFSQLAMAASDLVVLASGTATLEAMLLSTPMVVVYQLNNLTYQIAKRLVKTPYVALPNILAGKQIVPELIQAEANTDNLCRVVNQMLQPNSADKQINYLIEQSNLLRQQSNQSPANCVIEHWLAN